MSEPEKNPVEPKIDSTKEIKPANDAAPADKTATPAAANTNKPVEAKTEEPAAGVTPVVDVAPKKDPLVSITPPVTPAATEAPVSNDNTTAPAVKPAAVSEAPATVSEAKPAANTGETVAPVTAEVTSPANPVADQVAAETPAPGKKSFLKKAFNFAVKAGLGAGVSAIMKSAALAAAGLGGAPVWATVLISGAAVGLGATLFHDFMERRELKKEGKELTPYFSKAHGKKLVSKKSLTTAGISTVAAIAGSMLFMGFHEGIIQGWWNHLTGHAPAALPVAPAVAPVIAPPVEHVAAPVVAPPVEHVAAPPVVVAPVHCVTPIEQFNTLVDGHHVSAQVQNALHRVSSANPRVHAQALKDLAYYAHNGFGGVPKNPNVAVELFKQAADAGNLQSQVDMTYLQHYGLDGVHADKAASAATMKGLAAHSHRASELVKAWNGAGVKSIVPTTFDSGSIVKGMTVGCAA